MGTDANLVIVSKRISYDREYNLFPVEFDHKYIDDIKNWRGVTKKKFIKYLSALRKFFFKDFDVEHIFDMERRERGLNVIDMVLKELKEFSDDVIVMSVRDDER